jgi:SHO1 osmosensor
VGWFIAFIGQIVAEARGTTNVVVSTPSDRLGVLWFGIFVQLFLLLGVAAVLASDGIATHRLQLSAWTAVALVFAVIGIDKGIYSDYRQNGALHAMGAGYFLLTIANVIWLFFFTAEEDSAVYALLSSLGSGGLSGSGGRSGRQMRGGNGSLSGGAISGPTGTSGFGTGFAAGSSSGGGYTQTYNNPSTGDITQGVAAPSAAMKSSHSLRSNTQSNAPGRVGGAAAAAPQSDFGAQSSHHQPTVPGSPSSSRPAGTVEGEPTPGYGYRARALYACEWCQPARGMRGGRYAGFAAALSEHVAVQHDVLQGKRESTQSKA